MSILSHSKPCKKCGEVKPLSEFPIAKQCTDGHTNECLVCKRARNRAHAKEYRLRPEVQSRTQDWRTTEYQKVYQRTRYLALKAEVINAYGGKCVCCGEDSMAFLTIDHKFNDGYMERPESGRRRTGHRIYHKLKQDGFPQGRLQVLCYNCNCSKDHDPIGHRLAHPRAVEIDGHEAITSLEEQNHRIRRRSA